MNVFRTISRGLVVTAVVFVGNASAVDKNIKEVIVKFVAPVLTKEVLKNQNPHLSAIAEAGVATYVNGHFSMPDFGSSSTENGQVKKNNNDFNETLKYFGANVTSRELAAIVAANTRFNKKYFEEGCDEYIGAVQYIGKPVSETIKKITPTIVETTHNSIAASAKKGKATLEFTISLG